MTKRKKNSDDHVQRSPVNKRPKVLDQKNTDEGPNGSQPKVDPTYGQRGAFPGLDDQTAHDGIFYGPANDGLEYLRMVRSEAKGVPNLLVAPSSPQISSDNLYEDYPQGFYHDGAYTATPLPSSRSDLKQVDTAPDKDQDPQEAYYNSLCARFSNLRDALRSTPPTAYSGKMYPYFLVQGRNKMWRRSIMGWAPDTQLLAQLSQENIVKGLRTLGEVLARTNLKSKKGKYIGVWAWGLLGRCREVGEMGSEEVGVLRDLAKQALWLLRRISAGEDVYEADEGEGEDDAMSVEQNYDDGGDGEDGEGDSSEDGESFQNSVKPSAIGAEEEGFSPPGRKPDETENTPESVTAAQERLLSSLGANDAEPAPSTPDTGVQQEPQTNGAETGAPRTEEEEVQTDEAEKVVDQETVLTTLDMIVTIVGEFYGQKDLLNGRLLWEELPLKSGGA